MCLLLAVDLLEFGEPVHGHIEGLILAVKALGKADLLRVEQLELVELRDALLAADAVDVL